MGRKIFIFQWWTNQVSDIEMTNAAFGSSGSFGSRVRSTCIAITLIQVKWSTSVQYQHLYMDQFINQNWKFHTLEDTSVSYHRQCLKYLSMVCHRKLATVWMISTAHFSVHILLLHHYKSNLAHLSYLYILVLGLYKSER